MSVLVRSVPFLRENVSLFPKIYQTVFALYLVSLLTSMSGMELFSTLLIALTIYGWSKGEIQTPRLSDLPFFYPLLAFIVVAAVGILFGSASVREKIYDLSRMRFFFIYAFLYFAFQTLHTRFNWIQLLAIVCAAIGVYGFVQHFVAIDLIRPEGKKVLLYAMQDEKIGPLVVGTFNHHLTFANIYLLYACLFLALGLSGGQKTGQKLFLGSFLMLLVAWTQSRMAWVAIPIAVLCIALRLAPKRALGVVGSTLVLLGAIYFLSPSLQQRFQEGFSTSQQLSYLPRVRLWHAQWEMFKERPLFGVGWNNNERMAKQYIDKLYPEVENNFYGHAHSNLLQILSTTGVLGIIAFLWLWAKIFVSAFRLSTGLGLGIFAALVGYQVQGLTQWNFGDAEVMHNLMFLWALLAVLSTNTPKQYCSESLSRL